MKVPLKEGREGRGGEKKEKGGRGRPEKGEEGCQKVVGKEGKGVKERRNTVADL